MHEKVSGIDVHVVRTHNRQEKQFGFLVSAFSYFPVFGLVLLPLIRKITYTRTQFHLFPQLIKSAEGRMSHLPEVPFFFDLKLLSSIDQINISA